MNINEIERVKELFLNGLSLRKIEKETGIDRKKISYFLKKENINIDKKISKEEIFSAYEMIKNVESITSVAKKYNISRHTLSRYLEKYNLRTQISPKNHQVDESKYDEIIKLYNSEKHYSIQSIAKTLSISPSSVWRCLRKNSIVKENNSFKKFNYNEDRFKDIKTEADAYWLGFLYADGYNNVIKNEVELTLQYEDINTVINFKEYIGDGKIKKVIKSGFPQAQYRFVNKTISNNLEKHGCIMNKSFTKEFPRIKTNLIRHFIRGYFDGNGNVTVCNNTITFKIYTASEKFAYSLKNILEKELETKINIHKRKNVFELSKTEKKIVKKFCQYIYKYSKIKLERKYKKFKDSNVI